MNIIKILKTVVKICSYVIVVKEVVEFIIKRLEPFYDNTEHTEFEDLPAEKE